MVIRSYSTSINIKQKKDGFRYSLEPFLLADFVENLMGDRIIKSVIDLGTGSGAIAMLMAERFETARIVGIDILPSMVRLARENVNANNLGNRISIINADIKALPFSEKYRYFEVVISNPPFIKIGSGRLSPNCEKSVSKHETMLTLVDFVKSAKWLLSPISSLVIAYLPERLDELIWEMRKAGVKPRHVQFVHHREYKDASIVLVEGVRKKMHGLRCLPPVIVDRSR